MQSFWGRRVEIPRIDAAEMEAVIREKGTHFERPLN
jgi:hypothetical protein